MKLQELLAKHDDILSTSFDIDVSEQRELVLDLMYDIHTHFGSQMYRSTDLLKELRNYEYITFAIMNQYFNDGDLE